MGLFRKCVDAAVYTTPLVNLTKLHDVSKLNVARPLLSTAVAGYILGSSMLTSAVGFSSFMVYLNTGAEMNEWNPARQVTLIKENRARIKEKQSLEKELFYGPCILGDAPLINTSRTGTISEFEWDRFYSQTNTCSEENKAFPDLTVDQLKAIKKVYLSDWVVGGIPGSELEKVQLSE
jgi:hypothetical protein